MKSGIDSGMRFIKSDLFYKYGGPYLRITCRYHYQLLCYLAVNSGRRKFYSKQVACPIWDGKLAFSCCLFSLEYIHVAESTLLLPVFVYDLFHIIQLKPLPSYSNKYLNVKHNHRIMPSTSA